MNFPPPYQVLDDKKTPSNVTDWSRQVRNSFTSFLSKNVGGGSQVALTSDESYNNILVFTGVLTANINVVIASITKQWTVTNNTTGAFTLTIKTLSGSGVIIGQGKTAHVYGDGTNVIRATADV